MEGVGGGLFDGGCRGVECFMEGVGGTELPDLF
jgi:hypothetical protein